MAKASVTLKERPAINFTRAQKEAKSKQPGRASRVHRRDDGFYISASCQANEFCLVGHRV